MELVESPILTSHPNGTGFGHEAQAILARLGGFGLDAHDITGWDGSFEWDEFEQHSKVDAALGFPLLFSLPTAVTLGIQNPSLHFFG